MSTKVLVVGLGSMGKRRIRCLQRLGIAEVTGFDPREDRRAEASGKYQVEVIAAVNAGIARKFDAMIVSTPPDRHIDYINIALAAGIPSFVEASVTIDGLGEAEQLSRQKGLLIAPSCTMRFHPAIRQIKKLATSGDYGRILNFSYQFGQFLPDWHPWEKVTDFYVSKKETGACREMVSFELTWLADIVGLPLRKCGYFGQTTDVGAQIDDTYCFALKFDKAYGIMMIDVVSRYATRNLTLNLERGQIEWRWDTRSVLLYDANDKQRKVIPLPPPLAHEGYNENIGEDMYVDEMAAFLNALSGGPAFPNTLTEDMQILRFLYEFEGLSGQ